MAFSVQDEEQRWLKHAYTKPIDVEQVKKRSLRFEGNIHVMSFSVDEFSAGD